MSKIGSFPKIFTIGHGAIMGPQGILVDDVIVEEKVDGSQISFGVVEGTLSARSKGKELLLDAPDKMFNKAAQVIKDLEPLLTPGYVYRGEYLQSPKHNSLTYERTPNKNIILFDIQTGMEQYLSYEDKSAEAARLGLEVVPLIYKGKVSSAQQLVEMLDRVSVLGKAKIEGVVVKNYNRFTADGKVMLGKCVSDDFKEVHRKEWKKSNPSKNDVLLALVDEYKSPARWDKAIIHAKEDGILKNAPEDIGKLIPLIQKDLQEEEETEIKEKLYKWALPHILRGSINGFPEYYKAKLMEEQFGDKNDE